MGTHSSKKTDKSTYNKLLPRADGPHRIIGFQRDTLTINENDVPKTISMDRATPAPSRNTNASVGKGRNTVEGKRAIIRNEYQAPKGDVAESEQYDTDKRPTKPTPTAIENIDAHQPRESKDLHASDENKEQRPLERIETQGTHSGKPVTRWINVNKDDVDTREYAVQRIVRHTEKDGRTHYVVQWQGCTSKDDTVEPQEHLPDHYITQYWWRICKLMTTAQTRPSVYNDKV